MAQAQKPRREKIKFKYLFDVYTGYEYESRKRYWLDLDNARMVWEKGIIIDVFSSPDNDYVDDILKDVVNRDDFWDFFKDSALIAVFRVDDYVYVVEYSEADIPGKRIGGSMGLWEIPLEPVDEDKDEEDEDEEE